MQCCTLELAWKELLPDISDVGLLTDQLFDTVSRKYVEFSQQLETSYREETHIFAVLKRK